MMSIHDDDDDEEGSMDGPQGRRMQNRRDNEQRRTPIS